MTVRRALLSLTFAVVPLLVAAAPAGATHPRPKGADPLRVSLVPAYNACAAPNRTHGPPLAFPSCNPPAQSSPFLTVGTPDANGAPANSSGFIRFKVTPGLCCPPQDVTLTGTITDVRCKAGATPCGNANTADGADYVGELMMDTTARITDHNNGPNHNEPATVVDIPVPAHMFCGNTADAGIGATCSIISSALAIAPSPPVPPRSVVELGQVKVFDGGSDGQASTTPNSLFAVQGIFIP